MCNGSLSLDEAFFGEPHAKNTSYAMAKGTHARKMGAFSSSISIEKLKAQAREPSKVGRRLSRRLQRKTK